MTASRRFLLTGLVVGAVEALLGVLALPTGLAPYLFACAGASIALALGVHRLLGPAQAEPGDEPPGGGGGPPPPDDPPPPPWWPEFEAAFRAYARERGRPRARS